MRLLWFAFLSVACASAAHTKTQMASTLLASQSCRLPDLPKDAECGVLSVPENWGKEGGRRVALWLVRLPAKTSGSTQAIYIFQGGPGQAATKLADFYARVYGPVRATHDIILVDQRGTGRSNPLTCTFGGSPEIPQRYLADLFEPDAIRICRDVLATRADLTQYTTLAAVRDVEAVRDALGYGQLDLYGTSYGTRLALEYARRYPTRVRTMTLKGVLAPDVVTPEDFASDVQRSVGLLTRDCQADIACAAAFPNLDSDLQVAVRQFEDGPVAAALPGGNRITLSRGLFGATFRTMLQATSLRSELPKLIHFAAKGNWDSYVARAVELRKAGQSEIATGLMLSVFCAEDVPYLKGAKARQAAMGTVLGSYWLDQLTAACTLWPRGLVPADWRRSFKVGTPTLLISGGLDPATPPSAAERARRHLTHSLHVVVPNGSHSFSGLNGCIDIAMSLFVTAGRLDVVKPECAAAIVAPPFKVN